MSEQSNQTKDERRYCFRPGSRVQKVSPDAAGNELQRIIDKHGKLTPELTVEESRPEDAPCHPAFEWNDPKAAHGYRLDQARHLIKAVCVVAVDLTGSPEPVYAHVTVEDEGKYMPVSVIVRDDDLYESARKELQRNLTAADRAVRQIEEAARKAKQWKKVKQARAIREPLEHAMEAAGQEAAA